ncbi:hypothetical protein B0H14DRAFT_2347680 [Mycena olivaceomarginata]|nr:hypothetical protein B0H14DRAFT_2347680 [Mycena olivaceomarginata]
MSVVNPRDHLPHLVTWGTFNIFSACANVLLLALTLISQRWEANFLLLHLELIFVLTSGAASLLIWTGHALDLDPPYGLCLPNALAAMSNTPLQGGSAFAIVLKVWGSVMIACHPRWRRALEWSVSMPVVCRLWSLQHSFFIGLDHNKVYRGSPFYCMVDHPALQNAASGFGATYTFLCLVLSGWTTYNLITTRWRVRRIIDYPGVSYAFVIRTLVFSIFVGVAFVVGIISLVSSFSAMVPDVALSSCNVAVFFIFATSRPIIQFLFRCRRVRGITTTRTAFQSAPSGRSRGTNTLTVTEGPQEMVTFAVGSSKVTLDYEPPSVWQFKTDTTTDFGEGKSKDNTPLP